MALTTLAGRFRCYALPNFREHQRRILYIGKATSGSFDKPDDVERSFNGQGAFWDFARKLSELANPDCNDLSNVAWSNIFKQGVVIGNPLGEVAEDQIEEATRMLRKEVNDLAPTIIVLVTIGYYEKIVKNAYNIAEGEIGEQALRQTKVEGEVCELWSRPRLDEIPPVVWLSHPMLKRREYLQAALSLTAEIADWH